MDEQILTPAEKYYQNHLAKMREYNKVNKDAINEKNRQYRRKVLEDPEKRERYLEVRRKAYHRRKMRKQQNESTEEL